MVACSDIEHMAGFKLNRRRWAKVIAAMNSRAERVIESGELIERVQVNVDLRAKGYEITFQRVEVTNEAFTADDN